MSTESLRNLENQINPAEVSQRQLELGTEWADLFATTGTSDQAKSAEITLRNPAVYLQDVSPWHLPKELQEKWSSLLELSDSVAKLAATEDIDWGNSSSGLDKMQQLMFTGRINPRFRGSIADVMRVSSELFAESTAIAPGNTSYYRGNVQGMKSWIQKYRQPIE